jgi:hypothetical protein
MAVAPSRVARHVAAKEWGTPDRSKKYADGAYWYSTPGHGGTVVLLDRFPPEVREALARERVTGVVLVTSGGKLYYSGEYRLDGLLTHYENHGGELVHVAVGEEDVAWAMLHYADDTLREGAVAKGVFAGDTDRHYVEATVKNWYPDYYEALTGVTLTGAESYMMREREFEAANVENYVARAAWGDWHEKVPEGMVGVAATRKSDGDERYFLVAGAEYKGREGKYVLAGDATGWEGP